MDEAGPSMAFRVAQGIEWDLSQSGAKPGELFATFAKLGARYGAGERVVREAARILEFREIAVVKQGRGGGLVATSPSSDFISRLCGGYLRMTFPALDALKQARLCIAMASVRLAAICDGVGAALSKWLAEQPISAQQTGRVQSSALALPALIGTLSNNAIANVVAHAIGAAIGGRHCWNAPWVVPPDRLGDLKQLEIQLTEAIGSGKADAASQAMQAYLVLSDSLAEVPHRWNISVHAENLFERTRAGQLAREITGALITDANARASERRIGSVRSLCDEYSVSRSTALQAIRILQSTGTIEARPGRGKGFFVKTPDAILPIEWLLDFLSHPRITETQRSDFSSELETAMRQLGIEPSAQGCLPQEAGSALEFFRSILAHAESRVSRAETAAIDRLV